MSDESFSMRSVTAMVRKVFGDVEQLSTATLQEWLVDDNTRKRLLILDAREQKEFEVSHLKDARQTSPAGEDYSTLATDIEQRQVEHIVLYCSVGYRSAKIAQKLKMFLSKSNKDHCKVYNLEGSIFKWANEGRHMVDMKDNDTIYAHPYNAMWGRILESSLRKWSPDSSL